MAKRLSVTTVTWASSIEKFHPEDRVKLQAFKAVVDKYLKEVNSRPAEMPKIDWNYYKSRISAAGMVETFQKSYESFKVPYPSDQGLIAETEKYNELHLKKSDEEFEEVRKTKEKLTKELQEKEKMMPISLMTMEEFYLARPEMVPKLESFWPRGYFDNEEEEKSHK